MLDLEITDQDDPAERRDADAQSRLTMSAIFQRYQNGMTW